LEEVGKVIRFANSGRLIIKIRIKLNPGTILFDEKRNKIAKVLDLIGSTKYAYASAIPLMDKVKILGSKVYV